MLNRLLQIRRQWIWIPGFVILALFSLRSRYFNPWVDVNACLANPEKYHGKQVTHLSEPRIGAISDSGFVLIQKSSPDIFVQADTTGLKFNDYINLMSTFHKKGFLVAQRLEPATRRRFKIAVSVIPFLFLVGWSMLAFRVKTRPFTIEPKRHA